MSWNAFEGSDVDDSEPEYNSDEPSMASNDFTTNTETTETTEALEHRVLESYKKALDLQRASQVGQPGWVEARQIYESILQSILNHPPWVRQRHRRQRERSGVDMRHLPVRLQFLCAKQLGSIAESEGNLATSVQRFVEALEIDDSDVVTWFHAGRAAASPLVGNVRLARHCFEFRSVDHSIVGMCFFILRFANGKGLFQEDA